MKLIKINSNNKTDAHYASGLFKTNKTKTCIMKSSVLGTCMSWNIIHRMQNYQYDYFVLMNIR